MKKILIILCLILCSCNVKEKYTLYVYYAPTCRVCDTLMKLVINDIEEEYSHEVDVIKMDIDKEEHIEAYAKTCTLLENYVFNEHSGDVPFLVLDGYFAKSGFEILESDELKQDIINCIENKQLPKNKEGIYYFKEGMKYK